MPVDQREVTELFNGIRILFNDETAASIIEEAADAIGILALDKLGDIYPPDPPTGQEASPLRTVKQKRWFWANMTRIANGEPIAESLRGWRARWKKVNGRKTLTIDPRSGYKRTGTLVRSINYTINKSGRGITVAIGPTMAREGEGAEYASFVIGLPPPDGNQAAIHRDRWVPLVTAIADMSDELLDKFEEELVEGIRRRFKGHGASWAGTNVR